MIKLIKKVQDKDGYSYLFKIKGLDVWVDAYQSGVEDQDYNIEYNQYIFSNNQFDDDYENDQKIKAIQDNIENYTAISELIYKDLCL